MTNSTNEVHLIGHAGKDAEVKQTSTGKTVSKFSLATGGGRKKGSDENWPTDWHRCVAWGEQLGEIASRIEKGSTVEIVGRLQYGSYEKDGRKVYTTDIVCHQITLPEEEAPPRELPVIQRNADLEITEDDSIPF